MEKWLLLLVMLLPVLAQGRDSLACQGPKQQLAEATVYFCVNTASQRVWAVTYASGEIGVFTQIPVAASVAHHVPVLPKADSDDFYSTATPPQVLHVWLTEEEGGRWIQMSGGRVP